MGEWRVEPHGHALGDIDVVIEDGFKIYFPMCATNWDDAKRRRMRAAADLIASAPAMKVEISKQEAENNLTLRILDKLAEKLTRPMDVHDRETCRIMAMNRARRLRLKMQESP